MAKIKVRSNTAGFRRAGRAFSTEDETIEVSAEALKQLQAEPELTVTVIDAAAAKPAAAKPAAAKPAAAKPAAAKPAAKSKDTKKKTTAKKTPKAAKS